MNRFLDLEVEVDSDEDEEEDDEEYGRGAPILVLREADFPNTA